MTEKQIKAFDEFLDIFYSFLMGEGVPKKHPLLESINNLLAVLNDEKHEGDK